MEDPKQPTFEDDLIIYAKKRPKTTAVKKTSRLNIASKNSFYGVLESFESEDLHVRVYPLNYGMSFRCADVEVVPCYAIRKSAEAENLDVCEEKGDFEPGKAELDGFAVLAYEIAEDLVENPSHIAIIASFAGGDAVKLLAGLVNIAIRKIDNSAACKIVGYNPIKPKSANLKNLCDKFSKMSKTVSRAGLSACIP